MMLATQTIEELHDTIRCARQELAKRELVGVDVFKSIKGQEHCKRALIVAAIQGHTVGVYGPYGLGKTMLVRAGAMLGVSVIEGTPCPCSFFTDPRRPCKCTVKAIERHQRRLRETVGQCDLHVECPAVPASELLSCRFGTDTKEAMDQIAGVGKLPSGDDRQDGVNIVLKQAIAEIGLSAATTSMVVSVAQSVAALAHSERIGVDHILEAIHYRPLDRVG